MIESFESYARLAGAQVSVTSSQQEAADTIASLASGVVRCTAAVQRAYPELCSALEQAGLQVEIAEALFEAEPSISLFAARLAGGTGVILAHAGVAETGSLVLADDALPPRLLSMLADTCIVLLPASTILADLDEAGVLLDKLNSQGHRYVSLVTGPSRTADIERVLTIGVQGPKILHVIVLTNI